MKKRVVSIWQFIKQVFSEFAAGNILKYSASLAYYTVLSIAPLLVIVLSSAGFLFGRKAINGELYGQIDKMVGKDAALQIQTSIQNIKLSTHSVMATTIGVIVLIIGATGIFGEIQDSLNRIWGLKIKATRAWWKVITDRLISFSLILSLGFVLIVSLVLNAVAAALSNRILEIFPGMGDALLFIVDAVISLGITTALFGTIFKILPDARIKWRDVLTGAFITSLFFMVGKYAIGFYLGKSTVGSIYGAAGSIMILMIWVYYSSAILYLGAIFTKIYATNYGGKIYPNDFSVWIKVEEVPVTKPHIKDIDDTTVNKNDLKKIDEKKDPDH